MKIPAFAPRSLGEVGPTLYRLILSFILFIICYLLFAITPTFASATFDVAQSQPNPYTVPNTTSDVPKNLHTWTQTVMIEVMSAMSCQLSGIDPTNPKHQCLGVDSKSGKIGFVEGGGGAIGVAGKMIGMLYTPPLHTGDYFKYLASNFGIAKQAHAATGFQGLKPVQSLWVAFRNIVYLLFVIVFVVIGLAIMLRVKIDPRTVMTIQNQIPKIIIGILLVTFSFAIAGFLIDLMYVVIFLSYELISGAGVLDAKGVAVNFSDLNPLNLQNATPFKAVDGIGGLFSIAWNSSRDIGKVLTSLLLDNPFGKIIAFAIGSIFGFAVEKATGLMSLVSAGGALAGGAICAATGVGIAIIPICAVAGGFLAKFIVPLITGSTSAIFSNEVIGTIAGVLAFLVISIALLFALIRLWFSLIIAYVSILIDVVFAPFWIAGALLPGSTIGFGAWLRSIISNLAAFPATILMFLLARAFIEGFGDKPSPTDFVPPLIGNFAGTDSLGSLIGLGIILLTHNVVHLVKAALKAPSTPFGAIGAAVGVGTGVVSSPFKYGGQALTSAVGYKLSQRIKLPKFLGGGAGGTT